MDQNKLISVVIPTFNSEKYIYKCISTVLNQTYKNFEIIIVDNSSSDDTLNIINSFNSDKIRIFNIVNNGNISKSRNVGIKNSNGFWIAFLDSDDYWEKNKLELLSKKFDKYDLIFHDMWILKNKKIIKNFNFLSSRLKKKDISITEQLSKNGNPIINSSVIVKKNILSKVDFISEDEPSFTNDYHTWLKISSISNKFYYESKKLGTYLVHDLSYSHNIKNSYYYLKCIVQFKKFLSKKVKKKVIGYYNYEKGKDLLKKSEYKKSIKCFYKSFLLSDFEIKIKSFFKIILYSLKKN